MSAPLIAQVYRAETRDAFARQRVGDLAQKLAAEQRLAWREAQARRRREAVRPPSPSKAHDDGSSTADCRLPIADRRAPQ